MKKLLSTLLSLVIVASSLLGSATPALADPGAAPNPTMWQLNSQGLSVTKNPEHRTGGLGFTVTASDWPKLGANGGAEDLGWGLITGPTGIDLGVVKIPGAGASALSSEQTNWAGNNLVFNAGSGYELGVFASRITPAIRLKSPATSIRLVTGSLPGHHISNGEVVAQTGQVLPKYYAVPTGGKVTTGSLSRNNTTVPALDQNWMLVWLGNNSHIIDTKAPLSYASLRNSDAYQADIPLLIIFQNNPNRVAQSAEGGLELGFSGQMGSIAVLPLLGRDHPAARTTETWAAALPADITTKARFWGTRLCDFPTDVSETYAYNDTTDLASITETFTYAPICSNGVKFAPLPPMLALAKDKMGLSFSSTLKDGGLNTEFGPMMGFENTTSYTWSAAGLRKYTEGQAVVTNAGQAPQDLTTELDAQVDLLMAGGHYAPWVFTDSKSFVRGDIYWMNPAESLEQLIGIAAALPAGTRRDQFISYIRSERTAYPPEDITGMPLQAGTARGSYNAPQSSINQWASQRGSVFFSKVTLYNYYALAQYYRLVNETPPAAVITKMQSTLDRSMMEQDWATMYWFSGFEDRRVAVVNGNRHFAGMVGYVQMARQAGSSGDANLGMALLAKAAALRAAMAVYPRYEYQANLTVLPANADWMVKDGGDGLLWTYSWTSGQDDARQVSTLNQFEVFLFDHSGYGPWTDGWCSPYFTAYRDLSPELARFLINVAANDVNIFYTRALALFPNWWMAFAEGNIGTEHNLAHPVDSYQMFMYQVYAKKAQPAELYYQIDIPWLDSGDLFYMRKLAETINAYRGTSWSNDVQATGAAGKGKISLAWQVPNPPGVAFTWQISYTGPAGSQPSPINNIPQATRTYTLTGLTNNTPYTITIRAVAGGQVLLTSDPITLTPASNVYYLPLMKSNK